MKKIIMISSLIFLIVASMISGTAATYTKTLEPISAKVTAKYFNINTPTKVFPKIKLAPTETSEWSFSVVNYENNNVTEVNMDMTIHLKVGPAEGKNPIDGLHVSIYDESNVHMGETIVRSGEMSFTVDKAFLANEPLKRTYKIKAEWMNGEVSDAIDTSNAQDQNTTIFELNITGTQSQEESGDPGDDPSQKNNLWYSGVSTKITHDHGNEYFFEIINHGDTNIIDGWVMELDNGLEEFFKNFSSSHLMPHGTWNNLVLMNTQGGAAPDLLRPALMSYALDHLNIPKGESLKFKIQSDSEYVCSTTQASVKIRKPYVIDDISVSFDNSCVWRSGNKYKGNFYIQISNPNPESFLYGWSLEFKTNAILNGLNHNQKIELLSQNQDYNTYRVSLSPASNTGEAFVDAKELKKQVGYLGVNDLLSGDTIIVTDVKLNGQKVQGGL